MPFSFIYVCDLLDKLADFVERDVPLLPKTVENRINERCVDWFAQHCNSLNASSTDEQAVLMFLNPEKWTDRDYGLDSSRLGQLIARALHLPRKLVADLQRWQSEPARGDIAVCLERVMQSKHMASRIATRAQTNKVTVEEIDRALLLIATRNANSSSAVKSFPVGSRTCDPTELLTPIYNRLQPREAKWLTRLILKDYGLVKFPSSLDCSACRYALPRCLQIRAQFQSSAPALLLREGSGVIRGNATAEGGAEFISASAHPRSRQEPNHARRSFGTERCINARTISPSPIRKRSSKRRSSFSSSPPAKRRPRFVRGAFAPQSDVNLALQVPVPVPDPIVVSSSLPSLQDGADLEYGNPRPEEYTTPASSAPLAVPQAPSTPSLNTRPEQASTPRNRETACSLQVIPAQHSSSILVSLPPEHHQNTESYTSPPSLPKTTQVPKSSQPTASGCPGYKSNPNLSSSQHAENPPPSRNQSPSPSPTIIGTRTCKISNHQRCPLTNCIVLLPPSLSTFSTTSPLTSTISTLISNHGCLLVATPSTIHFLSLPHQCPRTGRRHRKIALVESRNTAEAIEFLNELAGFGLGEGKENRSVGCDEDRDRDTEKDWIEVYDWRILSCIAKLDRGQSLEYNPWRRCWIAAV